MSAAEVFHKFCGNNIVLRQNGRRAKRKDPNVIDSAVVFSQTFLKPDSIFQVKLIDSNGTTHLHIGVTIDDPGRDDVRWTYWRVVEDTTWRLLEESNSWVRHEHIGWCGSVIRACGKPFKVNKGDTLGVTRKSNDEVHFYVNDKDMGTAFLVGPRMKVWAAVELETTAKEISLPPFGGAISRAPVSPAVSVEVEATQATGDQVNLDDEDLDEQTQLLRSLSLGQGSQDDGQYSGVEEAAAWPAPAEAALLSAPAEFNRRAGINIILKDNYKTAKRRGLSNTGQAIVFSASPLQDNVVFEAKVTCGSGDTYINMGVTPIDPSLLEDDSIPERLFKMRCDSCVLNLNNLFFDGTYLRPYGSSSQRVVPDGGKVGILKTAEGDIHFYINGNDLGLALSGRDGHLWGIMEIPDDDVVLHALTPGGETFPSLVSEETTQGQIGGMSSDEEGQASGLDSESSPSPTSIEPPVPSPVTAVAPEPVPTSPVSPVSSPTEPVCPYHIMCQKFIDDLNLAAAFYNKKFDTCFCNNCHQRRGDNLYYDRGQPPKTYGIPIGWCKFGIVTPARADGLGVFQKWHMAFHGTKAHLINSILSTGDLLMPGDVTLEGVKIQPPPNHFSEATAPSGFDIKRVFLSPSILYAGCDVYAPKQSWTDKDTRESWNVRVALQVRIMPESYEVGRETIGLGIGAKARHLDSKFPNTELEWATNRRGSVILCGLLVKIENWRSSPSSIGSVTKTSTPSTSQARGFDG